MVNTRHFAERASKRVTREIGVRWGSHFPFYYVSEYPKSGGTWLARMVADYLQLPFPQHTVLPIGFSCVIRNEWSYHPGLERVFYLYRDGRDVMVSYLHHRIQVARHADTAASARVDRVYRDVLGERYWQADISSLLARFISFEFSEPGRGASVNWVQHVTSWYDPAANPSIAYLSYEALLDDCAGTLGTALSHITGEPVDDWRLKTAIEKYSMERSTGRKPGQEDVTSHIRKGIAGDWRQHFTREAAELFDSLAGDTLVLLGYEESRDWVDAYDYVSTT